MLSSIPKCYIIQKGVKNEPTHPAYLQVVIPTRHVCPARRLRK